MPTVQQLAIALNTEAVDGLKRNLRAMPEDRTNWKPLDKGRNTIDQITECVMITYFAARILTDRKIPDMDGGSGAGSEINSTDNAVNALDASIAALTAAIEAFPAEDLDATIVLPWFPNPRSFAEIMFLTYWNNVYHAGQIAYIQTLYGDNNMY